MAVHVLFRPNERAAHLSQMAVLLVAVTVRDGKPSLARPTRAYPIWLRTVGPNACYFSVPPQIRTSSIYGQEMLPVPVIFFSLFPTLTVGPHTHPTTQSPNYSATPYINVFLPFPFSQPNLSPVSSSPFAPSLSPAAKERVFSQH